MTAAPHRWKFVRVGGFDQVLLQTGADLLALGQLDQKLWVALACPVTGLEFDPRTLELIDTEKDGRIKPNELIGAIEWTAGLLKNVEDLAKGVDALPLAAINDTTDEGKLVLRTARELLRSLGKAEAPAISVADTTAAVAAFDQEPLNGDGVVVAESTADAELKTLIAEILSSAPGELDKSGKLGVGTPTLEAFWKDLGDHAAWLDQGERDPAVMPFGADSAAVAAALAAVRTKVDDFFGRCRLAAFDARAIAALNREEVEYLQVAAKDLTIDAVEIAHFPLASIAAGRALPLNLGVNPAWADRVTALHQTLIQRVLGDRTALTEAEWLQIRGLLSAHEAWAGTKAGAAVEKIGGDRIRQLLASDLKGRLQTLIEADLAEAPVANAIANVERLTRFHRDLIGLANNFVSFRDFYSRQKPAIFQIGTLYIDTRACELVLRVNDAGKHAAMAPLSKACLLYCDATRNGVKIQIVAAMTGGDVDNLMVGRNGLFYDRKGDAWDATITKIIDNPISVRQAFWAPYKKLIRFVEEQIAARAAAADSAANEKLIGGASSVQTAATTAPDPAAPPAPPKSLDIGIVAALGVAVGGITAAIGALLQAFFGLGIWMPLGVLGILLMISGPSMAVAWLKLRQRNLGPLLDANGWAVNAQALVNVPFGGSLTLLAALPKGSTREMADPYAEKSRPWKFYAFVLIVLGLLFGWFIGKIDPWLPGPLKSVQVLGEYAPAATPEAPAAEAPAAAPVEGPAAPVATPAPPPAAPAAAPEN